MSAVVVHRDMALVALQRVPTGYVAVGSLSTSEHELHSRDMGYAPAGHVAVESLGTLGCVMRARDMRYLPAGYVAGEGRGN